MVAIVGVLALQGGFARHLEMVRSLGSEAREVRYPEDLAGLDALIIPGGESSTISLQLDRNNLREALRDFASEKPVMGTCAGLILISMAASDDRIRSLGLIDVEVTRNSWGRQVHSFTTPLKVQLNGHTDTVPAVFIRAPRVRKVGAEVEVLASIDGEPVMVRQGRHVGVTFHPELTEDLRIHQYFLNTI